MPFRIIMNLMTQEQLERYEAFRRSAINKGSMRRVGQLPHFSAF